MTRIFEFGVPCTYVFHLCQKASQISKHVLFIADAGQRNTYVVLMLCISRIMHGYWSLQTALIFVDFNCRVIFYFKSHGYCSLQTARLFFAPNSTLFVVVSCHHRMAIQHKWHMSLVLKLTNDKKWLWKFARLHICYEFQSGLYDNVGQAHLFSCVCGMASSNRASRYMIALKQHYFWFTLLIHLNIVIFTL